MEHGKKVDLMAWKGSRWALLNRLGKAAAIDGVIEWADEATTCYPTACQTIYYTGPAPVTVQVPTSLSVISTTVLPTGSSGDYGCLPSVNYGIMVDIYYQVLDQNGNALASSSMEPQESGKFFDGSTLSGNIGPSRISDTSQFTSASGAFHDAPFGFCQNLPFQASQTYSANQSITILYNGTSYPVRIQNFTVSDTAGAAGFGHGAVANTVTSPGTGTDITASR